MSSRIQPQVLPNQAQNVYNYRTDISNGGAHHHWQNAGLGEPTLKNELSAITDHREPKLQVGMKIEKKRSLASLYHSATPCNDYGQ